MSERNNIQLAIGYGLGIGMFLAGILVVVVNVVFSFFAIDVGVFVLGGAVALGGVGIAVYNALKLDREALADLEDPSE